MTFSFGVNNRSNSPEIFGPSADATALAPAFATSAKSGFGTDELIARIIDAAIDNLDDVSMHDERSPLIGKSLRKLATSVNSIMAQLKPLSEQAKNDAEIASFEQLNEGVQSIMEAVTKLPPEVEKKAKKN